MHAWETIEHSLDYIDEHLGEEVKIEELAGMAALSPFYFQRLFKRLVHKPVQEYVKLIWYKKSRHLQLTEKE